MRLSYYGVLFVEPLLASVQKFQLVQIATVTLLAGVGNRNHIAPVLFQLHSSNIHSQFKILLLTFKPYFC